MTTQSSTPARMTYSVNEIAAILGVSRRTIYLLLDRGELNSRRIGGRQRITAAELDRVLQPKERADSSAKKGVSRPLGPRYKPRFLESSVDRAVDERPCLSDLLARTTR